MESSEESSSSISEISKEGYLWGNGKSCRDLASFFGVNKIAFEYIMGFLESKINKRFNGSLKEFRNYCNSVSSDRKEASAYMEELFSKQWLKRTIRSVALFSKILCYDYRGNILALYESECYISESKLPDRIFKYHGMRLLFQLQQVLGTLSPEAMLEKFTGDATPHRIYQKAIMDEYDFFTRVFEVDDDQLNELCHYHKMEEFILEYDKFREQFLALDHSHKVDHKGYMSLLVSVLLLLDESELEAFFCDNAKHQNLIEKIVNHKHIKKQGPVIMDLFEESAKSSRRPIYEKNLSERLVDNTSATTSEFSSSCGR